MTNARLFDILEYLIDHTEYFYTNSEILDKEAHLYYITKLRNELFTGTLENEGLTFKVNVGCNYYNCRIDLNSTLNKSVFEKEMENPSFKKKFEDAEKRFEIERATIEDLKQNSHVQKLLEVLKYYGNEDIWGITGITVVEGRKIIDVNVPYIDQDILGYEKAKEKLKEWGKDEK